MTSPTRIEVIDRRTVISIPVRLPIAFMPHLVLIAVIVVAWTADGLYELARWIV